MDYRRGERIRLQGNPLNKTLDKTLSPKHGKIIARQAFSGDRDEILNPEVGLRRNNDSSTLPSGFNCSAVGLGVRVFTQPGLQPDITDREANHNSKWRTGTGLISEMCQ